MMNSRPATRSNGVSGLPAHLAAAPAGHPGHPDRRDVPHAAGPGPAPQVLPRPAGPRRAERPGDPATSSSPRSAPWPWWSWAGSGSESRCSNRRDSWSWGTGRPRTDESPGSAPSATSSASRLGSSCSDRISSCELRSSCGPILALVGGVYWTFLRQYDINYYLANRPPAFLWAGGIAGVLVAVLAGPARREGRQLGTGAARRAVREPAVRWGPFATRSRTRAGHRWTIFWWIVAWLVAAAVASTVLTWTIGLVGRLIVPVSGDTMTVVALTMGAIGLLSLVDQRHPLLPVRVAVRATGGSPVPRLLGTWFAGAGAGRAGLAR